MSGIVGVMERTPQEIGEYFKRRREVDLAGLTQEAVGERGNAGTNSVQKVEYGEPSITAKTYAKVAQGLDWPPDAAERLRRGEDPDDSWEQPHERDVDLASAVNGVRVDVAQVKADVARIEDLMRELLSNIDKLGEG